MLWNVSIRVTITAMDRGVYESNGRPQSVREKRITQSVEFRCYVEQIDMFAARFACVDNNSCSTVCECDVPYNETIIKWTEWERSSSLQTHRDFRMRRRRSRATTREDRECFGGGGKCFAAARTTHFFAVVSADILDHTRPSNNIFARKYLFSSSPPDAAMENSTTYLSKKKSAPLRGTIYHIFHL